MFNLLIKTVSAQAGPIGVIPTVGGFYCLFVKILDWMFSFIVLIAIFVIISIGLNLIFRGGDPSSRAQSLNKLYFSVSGIAVVMMAWTIVTLVIPRFIGIGDLNLACPGEFNIFDPFTWF